MTALVEVGAHARKLRTGPHRMAPVAALIAAANYVRSEEFLPVGDEYVPFTLLEAAGGGKRSIKLEISGTQWTSSGGATAVTPDESTLLIQLQPAGVAGAPIQPSGTISISVDDAKALVYDYSLDEVRAALAANGDGRQTWRYTVPLQGVAAEGEAIDKRLALVDLELRGQFKVNRFNRMVAKLDSVAIRVNARPTGARAPFASAAGPTGLEPAEASTPPPVPPRDDDDTTVREAARELVGDDKTASVYFVRTGGRTLFEAGPRGVVELGEATRALSAAAVLSYVLNHTEKPLLGEIVLADRTLVGRMLDEAGAKNVHRALRELYERGNAPMPSLGELIGDMAGLPMYVPHTTHDQHALVADVGGRPTTGDVERDFAAALDKTALINAPGAVYAPSAIGWAVLLFMLPGWERNVDVVRMLAALAGPEHAKEVQWPASPAERGYQSLYRLWAGMRASPAAVAHMLSHQGWFGGIVDGDLGWLHVLFSARAPISPQLTAASGGWMRLVTPEGYRILTASGTYDNNTTVLAVSPELGLSGVYVERGGNTSAAAIAARMAKFMARIMNAKPPARNPAAARMRLSVAAKHAAHRAAAMLRSGPVADLQRHFSGRFVAINEPQTSLTIVTQPTAPDRAQRNVLVLDRGTEHTEMILAYDPEAPPNPANVGGARGAMRIVDPLTHALGDAVYFEMVQSSSGRAEPIVSALGRIFARENVAEEMRARYDAMSEAAQRRVIAAAERAAAERAAAERAAAARAQQRRAQIRDGELSDDDEEDDAAAEPVQEMAAPIKMRLGDMFDALAAAPPANKARTQFGRWHAYIGTDSNRASALVHAYPAGGRAYPLGAFATGATSPYYL